MKKKSFICCMVFLSSLIIHAQKTAFIINDNLLNSLQYKAAQSQLDSLSVEWKKKVEINCAEIDRLHETFTMEAASLDESQKKNREAGFRQREVEAKALLDQYFGANGQLFKKRHELLKKLTG